MKKLSMSKVTVTQPRDRELVPGDTVVLVVVGEVDERRLSKGGDVTLIAKPDPDLSDVLPAAAANTIVEALASANAGDEIPRLFPDPVPAVVDGVTVTTDPAGVVMTEEEVADARGEDPPDGVEPDRHLPSAPDADPEEPAPAFAGDGDLLPFDDYDTMTVKVVTERIVAEFYATAFDDRPAFLRMVADYEAANKDRKGVNNAIAALQAVIAGADAPMPTPDGEPIGDPA